MLCKSSMGAILSTWSCAAGLVAWQAFVDSGFESLSHFLLVAAAAVTAFAGLSFTSSGGQQKIPVSAPKFYASPATRVPAARLVPTFAKKQYDGEATDQAMHSHSRRGFLEGGFTAAAAVTGVGIGAMGGAGMLLGAPDPAFAADEWQQTPSGLKYVVRKSGAKDAAQPQYGDLAVIRFKGSFNGKEFDNIFESDEPLYWRVGSNTLLKGVEEAVPMMRVGDVWDLEIPPQLAFGKSGRGASAGKPRIPPNAVIDFTISLESVPGKDVDILDFADDRGTGPADDD